MPESMDERSTASSTVDGPSAPSPAMAAAPPFSIRPMRSACPASRVPYAAYSSSFSRESAMSRLRMVSWPMRSVGPNAASSTRSIDSLCGW